MVCAIPMGVGSKLPRGGSPVLDNAYSGVVGGHVDAWKDVLNGRCFGDSVHHVA